MFALIKTISNLPAKSAIILISLYQKTISPDHGIWRARFSSGYCKFQPTCSQYSKQAFEKCGFWKGLGLSAWRVMRCNPWNKGGRDSLWTTERHMKALNFTWIFVWTTDIHRLTQITQKEINVIILISVISGSDN